MPLTHASPLSRSRLQCCARPASLKAQNSQASLKATARARASGLRHSLSKTVSPVLPVLFTSATV